MAEEILLPKQGNSVESCIIVEWKVSEGASVEKGQPLMEVETDKATMEVESTASGVLLRQLVGEGDDVPVLSPVAIVGAEGEAVTSSVNSAGKAGSAAQGAGTPDKPATAVSVTPGGSSAQPASPAAGPATDSGGQATRTHRGGARISPRARRLASEEGVAFDGLPGSGPGGRIMVRDIEAAIASGGAGTALTGKGASNTAHTDEAVPAGTGLAAGYAFSAEPAQPVKETSVSGVRKIIAKRMHASLASTAQLTMSGSAEARSILGYRKRLKASEREELKSISINDLVLFATSRAVAAHPFINATYSDGTIREFAQVDLGFAVDTPRGLMVPVIRAADRRSLAGIAAEAHRLATACLEGSIAPDDLDGGTFTVTNLGAFGVESFTPVLNAPQVGILGVCAVVERPTAEGNVPQMGLSLTVDHQVVDGAPAARFLQAVGKAIEEIELTLAG